jgi:hypothetical protein
MQDSLARILALLESRQAYLREPDQVFTGKYCVFLTQYDQNTSFWKTSQQSFLTDSEQFSETWPRWGMTQDGAAYVHPMSERRITEIDGSYLPTPLTIPVSTTKSEQTYQRDIQRVGTPTWQAVLAVANRMWPTPTAHNAKENNSPSEANRNTPTLAAQVGGTLNPNWVAWLMGFPIGWASSKDTAMPKSRSKQQSRGNSLEVNDV